MSMNVDGETNITANENVSIQSSQDVNVVNITAGNGVGITNHGSITGVGSDPAITADTVALDAISTGNGISTISGSDGSSITLDTNEIGIRGDHVTLDVKDDVALNDIVANQATITAGGDVTQKDGTQVDVSDLTVRADGSIGSENDSIRMNVDEITAHGGSVYIDNTSADLAVNEIQGSDVVIDTAGSINTKPSGMITAHNLTIRAIFDIGAKDQPIRLSVDGNLILNSLLGRVWYSNTPAGPDFDGTQAAKRGDWRVLIDPITRIRVMGRFAPDAKLKVTNTIHYAQIKYADQLNTESCGCEDTSVYSEGCRGAAHAEALKVLIDNAANENEKLLWTLISDGKTLYDFVLGIVSETKPVCTSSLYIEIDLAGLDSVYDGSLEGKTVYVMLTVAGKLIYVQTTVQEGKLRLTLDQLGMRSADYDYTQFIIVNEDTFIDLAESGILTSFSLIDADGNA